MTHVRGRRWLAAVVGGLVLGLAPGAGPPSATAAEAKAAPHPMTLTRRDVDSAAALLGFDASQSGAARDLFDAYQAELARARKAVERRVAEARREYEASGDSKALMPPEVKAAVQGLAEQAVALDARFLADLRAVLTDEQAPAWPRVERLIRRRELVPEGKLCGEDVDLMDLCAELRLIRPGDDAVATLLERYEADLDQAFSARAAARVPVQGKLDALARDAGAADAAAVMAELRRAGVPVRDVNDRYVALLGAALPEHQAASLRAKYDELKYPRIYKDPYPAKALDQAAAFKDLSPEQAGKIAELAARYRADAAAANAKWARAVSVVEKDGGGSPYWRLGMDPQPASPADQAMADAGEGRRGLDRATLAALRAILTEDQRDRLAGVE